MPELDHCLVSVKTALRVRDLIAEGEFLCPSCKEPIKPHSESPTGGAHFEHYERNLDCPLSDKRTAKILYAAYEVEQAAWKANGGKGGFLDVFLARHNISSSQPSE